MVSFQMYLYTVCQLANKYLLLHPTYLAILPQNVMGDFGLSFVFVDTACPPMNNQCDIS